MKIKNYNVDCFKQYHTKPKIIFSNGSVFHAEPYWWLVRIRTGIKNWNIDIVKQKIKV